MFNKDNKLEDIISLIVKNISPSSDMKFVNEAIYGVLRSESDIITENNLYHIQLILNNIGIKSFTLRIPLNDLHKIDRSYYPLLLVNNSHYSLIVKKDFLSYKLQLKDKIINTYKSNLAKAHNIDRDDEIDILMFEDPKTLNFLSHKHESPRTKLIKLLSSEKKDLIIIFTYSLIIGLLSLVIPVAIQSLVNTIAFATLLQPLIILTTLVVVALSFEALLRLLRTHVVELLQQRIFVRVSSDLAYRLPRAKTSFFDSHHGPELVNRFLDVLTVQKSSSTLLIDGLSILIQTFVGMVLLAFYHPILLVFDIIIVLCILFILFILSYKGTETSIKESKVKYKVLAWFEEIALNLKSFKSYNGNNFVMKNADYLVRDYLKARNKHFNVLFRLFSGTLFLQVLASSSLLGIGGWLVMQQQLTIGQLVAAELIVASIVINFTKFSKQLEVYYDLLAAIDKIGHLTGIDIEEVKNEIPQNLGQSLSVGFRNVSFKYNNMTLFKSLNFNIKPNTIFGIYSEEAGGKTTISDMIYGLRKPNEGIIEINKIDLQLINLDIYRENIAMVSQPEIIYASIVENIRMGRNNLHINSITEALEKVNLLNEVVNNLPSGLDTILSTGGNPLSYTSSIKLMIARAICENKSLIIFDGVLDYLDKKYIDHIFNKVINKANSTIIITTSNKDLLDYCDNAYDLNNNINIK